MRIAQHQVVLAVLGGERDRLAGVLSRLLIAAALEVELGQATEGGRAAAVVAQRAVVQRLGAAEVAAGEGGGRLLGELAGLGRIARARGGVLVECPGGSVVSVGRVGSGGGGGSAAATSEGSAAGRLRRERAGRRAASAITSASSSPSSASMRALVLGDGAWSPEYSATSFSRRSSSSSTASTASEAAAASSAGEKLPSAAWLRSSASSPGVSEVRLRACSSVGSKISAAA